MVLHTIALDILDAYVDSLAVYVRCCGSAKLVIKADLRYIIILLGFGNA